MIIKKKLIFCLVMMLSISSVSAMHKVQLMPTEEEETEAYKTAYLWYSGKIDGELTIIHKVTIWKNFCKKQQIVLKYLNVPVDPIEYDKEDVEYKNKHASYRGIIDNTITYLSEAKKFFYNDLLGECQRNIMNLENKQFDKYKYYRFDGWRSFFKEHKTHAKELENNSWHRESYPTLVAEVKRNIDKFFKEFGNFPNNIIDKSMKKKTIQNISNMGQFITKLVCKKTVSFAWQLLSDKVDPDNDHISNSNDYDLKELYLKAFDNQQEIKNAEYKRKITKLIKNKGENDFLYDLIFIYNE